MRLIIVINIDYVYIQEIIAYWYVQKRLLVVYARAPLGSARSSCFIVVFFLVGDGGVGEALEIANACG